MKTIISLTTGMGLGLALAGSLALARPAENVSGRRHPNLAAAQELVGQAFNKVTAAQQANEWDMPGHASKAKGLLDEANNELKAAAESANAAK
jgi:hypothetical protein